MSKHIRFDGFDCKFLQHVPAGSCWMCLEDNIELRNVEQCFRCKFAKQAKKEARIRKERNSGRIL